MKELSREQFLCTMGEKMHDVTETAEAVCDIWKYAEELSNNFLLSEYAFQHKLIDAVYENVEKTYQHILLFSKKHDCYVIIIIDVLKKSVFGHYLLDLNEEYGISLQ